MNTEDYSTPDYWSTALLLSPLYCCYWYPVRGLSILWESPKQIYIHWIVYAQLLYDSVIDYKLNNDEVTTHATYFAPIQPTNWHGSPATRRHGRSHRNKSEANTSSLASTVFLRLIWFVEVGWVSVKWRLEMGLWVDRCGVIFWLLILVQWAFILHFLLEHISTTTT